MEPIRAAAAAMEGRGERGRTGPRLRRARPPPLSACNAAGRLHRFVGRMIFLEEGAANIMTTIIAAMGDAFSLVGKVVTEITGQPILLFFLAASLIPVGIGIFKGLRRAAR